MSAPEPSPADDPLADAVARLDRAVSRVGARLEDYQLRLSAAAGDVEAAHELDNDRARLAAALDEARAREDDLQGAAEEAAQALDDAMADLKALLAEEGDDAGDPA
ncbi:DUF4164 family protein [Oceanicaulis sp. LC35]|uniref:DUF4164 family protein n=1 Tax=Oceanicaulis sp. LC35 TaxID=3349635 RepID=UPI003F8662F5